MELMKFMRLLLLLSLPLFIPVSVTIFSEFLCLNLGSLLHRQKQNFLFSLKLKLVVKMCLTQNTTGTHT